MTEPTVWITAVSVTDVWAETGLTADGVRFESSSAHGCTQVVKLSGPLSSAPAQRQLLAGGSWTEMAVHSVSENSDLWIESRITAAREDRCLHEGQSVTEFAGHGFDAPATITEVGHLLPGDVFWSLRLGLVSVVSTSRLGQLTKICAGDGQSERLDSSAVVPLCSRSAGATFTERQVPDYGGGSWTETSLAG